jgi:hypothetical protein
MYLNSIVWDSVGPKEMVALLFFAFAFALADMQHRFMEYMIYSTMCDIQLNVRYTAQCAIYSSECDIKLNILIVQE